MLKIGLIATAFAMSFSGIVADDVESSSEPIVMEGSSSVVEVYECTTSSKTCFINTDNEIIEDTTNKYGDVYLSSDEGHVGDTVTAIVSGNPTVDVNGSMISLYKYAIAYVTVNGAKIEPSNSEKGEYTFTLVEGANNVIAYFQNKTEMSALDMSTTDWKSLLTVDNLIRVIYLVLTLILSSGFFLTLIKNRKMSVKSAQQVEETTTKVAQNVVGESVNKFLTETVKPLLAKQTEQTEDSNETAKVLMRVMLLAQENTAESRLAITKELQNYKTTDKELAAQIQKIVEESIKKNEEDKKSKEDAIKAVKESISEVGDSSKDNYGTV